MITNGKWITVPIKELYEGLYDGPHATPKPSDAGPVFLGIKNVTDDGRLDLNDIRHINENEFARWTKRVAPRQGDIVFTYEATLNRYAIVPDGFRGCLGRRMALIRPNPEKVDTRFLHYYFFCKAWRDVIRNNMLTGATVDRIPLTTFPSFPVTLPDLPTQRKIAGILSAYDDLIENNLRRIRILEEMAQSLYREWFVHFRFPGHESTPMVDSPLGPIPEGWERKHLEEIANFRLGKMLDQNKNKGELMPYLANINVRWGKLKLDELRTMRFKHDELEIYGLKFGDIVMCEGGEPGRCAVWKEQIPGTMLQKALHRIRSRPNMNYPFLYYSLRHLGESGHLASFFTGATIKHLPREQLAKVTVLVPPSHNLNKFANFVEPIENKIGALDTSISNLRQTRNLLLPKLLSGQMTLDVAESDAAETVEGPAPNRPASRASAPVAISSATQRTVTTSPPKPAPPNPAQAAAPKADSPPPIDEIDRTEVLSAIRKMFNDGGWRDRDTTLKELSAVLGYGRLGSHIREVLSTDLLTAVRRGILTSEAGEYALAFRSVTELPRDTLKDRFLTAIGRPWITRDDAIRAFARSLGFARTGEQIDHTARSLINGLLREGRLESDGECIRRG
jgi:type I restriction enzyme S subunit